MPNWRIPTNIRDEIKKNVETLLRRLTDYALADFPLTLAQVQDMIIDPQTLSTLRRLEREGVDVMDKPDMIYFGLLREMLPDVPRSLIVQLWLPEAVFVPYGLKGNVHTSMFHAAERCFYVPDVHRLDVSDLTALAAWTNRVVRQRRLQLMAASTVGQILNTLYTPTTGHLLALWPQATMLVNDRTWRQRFSDPPKRMKPYRQEIRDRLAKRILATDTMLMQASIMAHYKHPEGTVRAELVRKEELPGEQTY